MKIQMKTLMKQVMKMQKYYNNIICPTCNYKLTEDEMLKIKAFEMEDGESKSTQCPTCNLDFNIECKATREWQTWN